jgi:hypothetical protein
VTLADGDSLVLRFDMRLVGATPATSDRSIRFGLYHDGGTVVTGDLGSTATEPNDDIGYNARLDAGAEATNSTSMDVTRDDSASATIIQGTATGISVASTNAADQLDDATSRHFVLTLTRSGTGMVVSLQQDSNGVISATDAAPPGFTYNEIAFGPRSNAAMDLRIDNIELEHVLAVPEPSALALLGVGGLLGLRRGRRQRS